MEGWFENLGFSFAFPQQTGPFLLRYCPVTCKTLRAKITPAQALPSKPQGLMAPASLGGQAALAPGLLSLLHSSALTVCDVSVCGLLCLCADQPVLSVLCCLLKFSVV